LLALLPDQYGANSWLNMDNFELFGWEVTVVGTKKHVEPCALFAVPHRCRPVAVDTRIRALDGLNGYDVVAVMPSTLFAAEAYGDLLNSRKALELISAANDDGLVLFAPCGGVRILAAAGVIDGKRVTGEAGFQAEYEAAGATYASSPPPPVIDGNLVTARRGLYYHVQIGQAIAAALESTTAGVQPPGEAVTHSSVADQDGALWTRTYGGSFAEGARSLEQTSDGGFIIAGYTYSFGAGNADLYLLKTDAEGILQWASAFGGSGWEYGNSAIETSDGGYLAVGYTSSWGAGSRDVYLVKTDPHGAEVWSTTFGGPGLDVGMSVVETGDGAYAIAGYTDSFGLGESDAYLIKLDSAGNELWSRVFGDTGPEMGRSLDRTSDGGFVIAGASGSYSDNSDVYLLRTDREGNELWSTAVSHPSAHLNYDWANSVRATADGGFVIAGNSDLEQDLMDLYLVKVDAQGNTEWAEVFGGSFYDYGSAVRETSDGDFIVSGSTKIASTGLNDVYVRKVDASGAKLWKETYGDRGGSEWGTAVTEASDGDVVIAGHTNSFGAGSYDVWLIRLDVQPSE
jgi:putative intracellular protease/amidase